MTIDTLDDDETGRFHLEPKLLGAAVLILLALLGFVGLVDWVTEGDVEGFDHWVLEKVRHEWVVAEGTRVADIAENITALGSASVLVFVIATVLGYLLLRRNFGLAIYTAVVTVGGTLISLGLKQLFDRPRPTIVEPLEVVHTASFPSGHSMSAAFVYLTLAALLVANTSERSVKVYIIGVGLLLTVMVGLTRVMLAVHYPTDVAAGWVAGLAWALICWTGYELLGEP